jgi:hypothetical protein
MISIDSIRSRVTGQVVITSDEVIQRRIVL